MITQLDRLITGHFRPILDFRVGGGSRHQGLLTAVGGAVEEMILPTYCVLKVLHDFKKYH